MRRALSQQHRATILTGLLLLLPSLVACSGAAKVGARPAPVVDELESLAAQLKDGSWQRRAEAARKLGATRKPAAVALLAGAVGDADQRVVLAVVDACGVHRSPKLIPTLSKALEAKAKIVRRRAVRALTRIGTREAAEAMIGCLDGASMWLRPAVADGLAAIPPKELEGYQLAVDILVAELDPARRKRLRRLAKALAALGTTAFKILLRRMAKPGADADEPKPGRPDTACVLGPCLALVSMGKPAIQPLLDWAREGASNVSKWTTYRNLLTMVFARMGKVAVPKMVSLVGGDGAWSRMAESALVKMGAMAVQPLLKLLRTPKQARRVRVTVVTLLGRMRNKQAYEGLLATLTDRKPAVAAAAAKGLASSYPKRAYSALLTTLNAGPVPVRLAIIRGAWRAKNPRGDRLLLQGLSQGELKVLLRAIQALGKRKVKAAVPKLLALLKHPKPMVRFASVKGLGRIGDQRATRPLLRTLRGRPGRKHLRVTLRALGRLQDPKAYGTLVKHSRRGRKALRLVAIAALGDLGTKRAKKLLGRLKKSKDKAIARAADRALNPSASTLGVLGIPECDAYLKVMSCYINRLPAATRGPAKAAFLKSVVAWKKMAARPGRASLAKACKMSINALRKALGSTSTYGGCFTP